MLLLLITSLLFAEHTGSIKNETKVYKGRKITTKEAYPGVLRLYDKKNDFRGTVIAINQCILSAAHNIKSQYSTNISINNLDESFSTSIVPNKLEIHEGFMTENYLTKPYRTHSEYACDIVVAKLKDRPPNSYNENILDEKFCKSFKEKIDGPSVQEVSALIAGYGSGDFSPYVTRGSVEFHDGNVKIAGYHTAGPALRMLPNPQLAVGGDSGGPVFVLDEHNNKKLVGIIASTNYESVDSSAADVCKHMAWIKKQLKDLGCL